MERDQLFRTRMSGDEISMLQLLAERAGVSASDVVRKLIRREYVAEFGQPPNTPKM